MPHPAPFELNKTTIGTIMRIHIFVDGDEYRSINSDGDVEATKEYYYENIESFAKMQLYLDGGGIAIFGKETIQRSVIVIK